MEIEPSDIRYILTNAYLIKRDAMCIHCNGTGYINWDGITGTDIKPGYYDGIDRDCDLCQDCDGIGFNIF